MATFLYCWAKFISFIKNLLAQEEDDGEIIDENESEGEDEVDTNADEPEEAKLPEDQSSSSDVRKRRTRKAD